MRTRVIQKKSGKGFLILQVTKLHRSALGLYQESGLGAQLPAETPVLVALLKTAQDLFFLVKKQFPLGVCSSLRMPSCKLLKCLHMPAEHWSHFTTVDYKEEKIFLSQE